MTHDDETVERVARAIYESGIPKGGRDYVAWENLDSEGFYAQHDLAMKQARAAITALPPRELLREALEALEPFVTEAHTYDCDDDEEGAPEIPDARCLRIEEADGTLSESIISVGDFRRARAAADKIRAALTQEEQT